ncbi:hypothetical protein EVAR_77842_1 [Eumeta japonica]|uniref:Uncharacterized protein n=1 Tax=Eumeta variegata TaxID=151549 RepID=A0A4C1TC71_EUMVA|nr:hypothetical protein EVAR_77842_1 [Eumeta japonica]
MGLPNLKKDCEVGRRREDAAAADRSHPTGCSSSWKIDPRKPRNDVSRARARTGYWTSSDAGHYSRPLREENAYGTLTDDKPWLYDYLESKATIGRVYGALKDN